MKAHSYVNIQTWKQRDFPEATTHTNTHANNTFMRAPPRTQSDGQTDVWFENDEAVTKLPTALFSTEETRV